MINLDKVYHFIAGFLLVIAGSIFYNWLGLLLGVVYGVGKEVYDYYNKENHTPDGADMIATVVGALLAYEIVNCL